MTKTAPTRAAALSASAARKSDDLDLRAYLTILRRRKLLVIAAVAVAVAASLLMSWTRSPVYEARATLLLQSRISESLFDPNTGVRSDPNRAVQTEIRVITSKPVRDAVHKELGPKAPNARAVGVGLTDVVEVRAKSTDPDLAARTVNSYAKSYINFRRSQAVNDLLAAGEEIQSKLDDLQRQVDQVPATDTAQRSALLSQMGLFKERLDQLQVESALRTGGAQLVTPADTPTVPVAPRPTRDATVAGILGLFMGIGLAFARDHLDDRIRSKDQLEQATGAAVLGMIPPVPGWRDRSETHVISLEEPHSPIAEAYRSLRTSVQFMSLDRAIQVLHVTSSFPGEGKSTTSANLATVFSRAGKRVVLVDCDLRRPRQHRFFGFGNEAGLTSVLLGDKQLDEVLHGVHPESGLAVLTSGPVPPNPSELLSSPRAEQVFRHLREVFDVVIIDSPPVIPVTDALVLSNLADATMLVATARKSRRKDLRRSTELIGQVNGNICGTVLNRIDAEEEGYGYGRYGRYRREYRYGYGYGSTPEIRTEAVPRIDATKGWEPVKTR